MVPDTPARRKARELKAEARELEQEAAILAGIQLTRFDHDSCCSCPKKRKGNLIG